LDLSWLTALILGAVLYAVSSALAPEPAEVYGQDGLRRVPVGAGSVSAQPLLADPVLED
jgi:hypothetical protein